MKFGEKNVGEIDRVVRAILGLALLSAYVGRYFADPWQYAALALGLLMVATAAYETCPTYSVLGISTCPLKPAGKKK